MSSPFRWMSCCLAVVGLAVLTLDGAAGAREVARVQARGVTATQASYLTEAQYGIERTSAWWSRKYHWYLETTRDPKKYPQASIWDMIPLFEAEDEVAMVDPTRSNLNAVNAIASHAGDYWNPHLRPRRGYAPYPGDNSPSQQTWFDDNGWLGLGFMDADGALHDNRYLHQAERAFGFIAAGGWDSTAGGGMWWNTNHQRRPGEALAADTYLAARLYATTGNVTYLRWAQTYVSWAESHLRGWTGIFARRGSNWSPMPQDGEGTLVSAFLTLCESTRVQSWCTDAESLGLADMKWLGPYDEGPQYDDILVRGMLTLYSYDHNARWYRFARAQADKVLGDARTAPGVYLRSWTGSSTVPDSVPNMLRTDASNVSVLAAMAMVPPPS